MDGMGGSGTVVSVPFPQSDEVGEAGSENHTKFGSGFSPWQGAGGLCSESVATPHPHPRHCRARGQVPRASSQDPLPWGGSRGPSRGFCSVFLFRSNSRVLSERLPSSLYSCRQSPRLQCLASGVGGPAGSVTVSAGPVSSCPVVSASSVSDHVEVLRPVPQKGTAFGHGP